jgi:hypothetical protein
MFRAWLAVTVLWCGLIACVSYAGFHPQIIDSDEQLNRLLDEAYDRKVRGVVTDVARPQIAAGSIMSVARAVIPYSVPCLPYFLVPPAVLFAFGYGLLWVARGFKRDQPVKT